MENNLRNFAKVQQRVDEITSKLEDLGFAKFFFTFKVTRDLKPRVAGLAKLNKNHIDINEFYLRDHEEEVIGETVPHEICHLYVNKYYPRAKQNHGPEFRRLMQAIGCSGSTYHKMQCPSEVKVRAKTKTRFVYHVAGTKTEVLMTQAQHRKHNAWLEMGLTGYTTKKREPIVFTGEIRKFK